MGLEHPLEMALVSKAKLVGHFRQGQPFTQQLPPAIDPGIEQVGMRGKPGSRSKRADQLIAPKPGLPRQYLQAQLRRVLVFDACKQPVQGGGLQGGAAASGGCAENPGPPKGNQRRIFLAIAGTGKQQPVQRAELPIYLGLPADTHRFAGFDTAKARLQA